MDLEQILGVYIVFFLFILAIVVVIGVFYLKNLQDTLKECAPHNQQVPPGNVWLMFIPIFNYIYPFILYPKISESLRLEFEERGHPQGGDYCKNIGITMPILTLCGWIPVLGGLAGLANFILWIIFWVKMAQFKNQLRTLPKMADGGVKFSANTDLLD
jgi:hypothetical protein